MQIDEYRYIVDKVYPVGSIFMTTLDKMPKIGGVWKSLGFVPAIQAYCYLRIE